jgi:2'-5' RNA ligase
VVQSVELLLEPEAERGLLRACEDLLQAGLPSQARHTAPSNRPHVTLVAVPDLPAAAEDDVTPAVAGRLPVDGTWGDVVLFGRGPWVLVRLLEPGDGMRALQAAVADACGVPGDSLSAPERWTAHVTLARRVSQPDVDRAVDLVRERLGREAPVGSPVVASAVRRWDGSRKVEWVVARAGGGGQP